MEQNEIVADLENLLVVLSELPDLKEDQRVENIWGMYKEASDKLLNYKISGKTSSQEAISLEDEIAKLKLDKDPIDKSVSALDEEIKYNDTKYNNAKKLLDELKEESNKPELSERKKDNCMLSIQMCERLLADIESKREELNTKLSEAKSKQEATNKTLSEKEKALEELYKKESDELELDSQTLYFAYDFFASNPKENIQSTINDLKDGVIELDVANERLQNLKALLSSGLYNLDEINEKVREKRKQDIAKSIELKEAEVRKLNNIDYLETQIKYHEEMLKRNEGDPASHKSWLEEYKSRIKYLFTHGEGAKELCELYELQSAYIVGDKVKENTFSDLLDSLINKTGGEQLVEKVGRQVPNYFPEEYLELLDKASINETNKKIDEALQTAGITTEDAKNKISNNINKLREEQAANPDLANSVPTEKGLVPVDGPKVEVKNVKDLEPSKLDKIKEWFNANWKKVTVVGASLALAVSLAWSSCCGVKKTAVVDRPAIVEKYTPEKEAEPKKEESKPAVTPSQEKKNDPSKEPQKDDKDEPVLGVNDYRLRTEETVQKEHGPVGDSRPADPDMSPQLHGNSLVVENSVEDSTIVLENPTTNTRTFVDSDGNKITEENGTYRREEHAQQVNPVGDGTVIVHNPNMSPVSNDSKPVSEPVQDSVSLDDYNKQKTDEIAQIEQQKNQGTISAEDAAETIAKTQAEIDMANSEFDRLFGELSEGKGR